MSSPCLSLVTREWFSDRFSKAGVTGCETRPLGVIPLGCSTCERSDVILDETGLRPLGASGGGSGEEDKFASGAMGIGGSGAGALLEIPFVLVCVGGGGGLDLVRLLHRFCLRSGFEHKLLLSTLFVGPFSPPPFVAGGFV